MSEERTKSYFIPSRQPFFIRLLMFMAITTASLMLLYAFLLFVFPYLTGSTAEVLQTADAIKDHYYAFLLSQSLYSILLFLLPCLVYAYLMTRNPFKFLQMQSFPDLWQLIFSVGILILSYFFAAFLLQVMEHIDLGDGFLAKKNEQITGMKDLLLRSEGLGNLLLLLVVLAVVPAVSEELFFRGVIQQLLNEGNRSIHMGVWFASGMFAATHLEAKNFPAMLFMGLILGYLFAYSGKLWLSILMHFLFNASQVLFAYFSYQVLDMDPLSETEHFPLWMTIPSGVAAVYLMFLFAKKYGAKKTIIQDEPKSPINE